ncbi:NAD(P)/FAD-dependent oxidoreductase [Jiangella rhizosphaerae]|uniref:NAD(P)/FAD-dependent oxidoreductase n=1 Tax=Jiangella rhizosphaerae TaxID=2293569 RepID=A0A418KTX3_9ACTN|nr:NAD(P)/FAD-dependent oxidoreductase [Jiangella rhizosphaerae]RIQ29570.1 NAD(P)/FAD-dependent oxidoreductase [Jiangella rhizosphaerae]
MTNENRYDVVVIGGGAAGLSGALTLSRARRSVLVIDAGAQRNAPAGGVHNYLGREGTAPAELYRIGRAEIEGYGGEFRAGSVTEVTGASGDFTVRLEDGDEVRARRILLATGGVDDLPDVPGVRERWGRDVLHCPYCHGWEVRDRAIGILATSAGAVHQAQLFRQWSADVTLFAHTAAAELGDDARADLAARGVRVVEGTVAALRIEDDAIVGVELESGDVVPVGAVVVQPKPIARAGMVAGLGLKPVEVERGGLVVGTALTVDPTGATAVPGIWAAGNVADGYATVIKSAAAGVDAAALINFDLAAEGVYSPVAEAVEPAEAAEAATASAS